MSGPKGRTVVPDEDQPLEKRVEVLENIIIQIGEAAEQEAAEQLARQKADQNRLGKAAD